MNDGPTCCDCLKWPCECPKEFICARCQLRTPRREKWQFLTAEGDSAVRVEYVCEPCYREKVKEPKVAPVEVQWPCCPVSRTVSVTVSFAEMERAICESFGIPAPLIRGEP